MRPCMDLIKIQITRPGEIQTNALSILSFASTNRAQSSREPLSNQENIMPLTRRNFFQLSASTTLGLAAINVARFAKGNSELKHPISKPSSNSTGEYRLGLAAYSLRKHFTFFKGRPQSTNGLQEFDMFSFIDYCASQQCAAELTSYFFPPDADQEYFLKIKRHAFLSGVPLVGTAIGNNFTVPDKAKLEKEITLANQWIDRASIMGVNHIRFFAGTKKQIEANPNALSSAIASLKRCAKHAAQLGIFIGVENHGQLTANQVMEIVNGVDNPWLGVNLDTGNFISPTPYQDLKKCAPSSVNVQYKVKMKQPSGEKTNVDMQKVNQLLTEANYKGHIVLEYEEENPLDNIPQVLSQMRSVF